MNDLSQLQLISPYPILINGVGHIKPPTISSILELGQDNLGQDIYNGYLSLLGFTVQTYFKFIGKPESYDEMSDEVKTAISVFDLMILMDITINMMITALQFFFVEDIRFDPQTRSLITYKKFDDNNIIDVGKINKDNYSSICKNILQLNFIDTQTNFVDGKPKNKKAAEILAKLQKASEERKSVPDENMSMANMIAALSAYHNSYNLTNVWSLTVYQLYDQFFRQNTKNQYDTYTTRWAAYGKEDFDFSLWYKKVHK